MLKNIKVMDPISIHFFQRLSPAQLPTYTSKDTIKLLQQQQILLSSVISRLVVVTKLPHEIQWYQDKASSEVCSLVLHKQYLLTIKDQPIEDGSN